MRQPLSHMLRLVRLVGLVCLTLGAVGCAVNPVPTPGKAMEDNLADAATSGGIGSDAADAGSPAADSASLASDASPAADDAASDAGSAADGSCVQVDACAD